MQKSCFGPQIAALIPGIPEILGADYYLAEVNSAIDSALEKEESDAIALHLSAKTSFQSPLGNHPDDIQVWEDISEGFPHPTPKAFIPSDVRAKMLFERILRYVLKSCSSFHSKSFKKLVLSAKKAIGGGTSERQLNYDMKKLKATGFFIIEPSPNGSAHENLVHLSENGVNKKESLFSSKGKAHPNLNASVNNVDSESKLRKLAHFLTNQLKNKHWDTCKVLYQAEIIFKSVFTALKNGVSRKMIVQSYESALHAFHEIATFQRKVFVPSGVANVIKHLNITQSIVDVKDFIERKLNLLYAKFEKNTDSFASNVDDTPTPRYEAPVYAWEGATTSNEFSKLLNASGFSSKIEKTEDNGSIDEPNEILIQGKTSSEPLPSPIKDINTKSVSNCDENNTKTLSFMHGVFPVSVCNAFYKKLKIKNNNTLTRPKNGKITHLKPPKQTSKIPIEQNPPPKSGLFRKTLNQGFDLLF
jgi:hypothetical protein